MQQPTAFPNLVLLLILSLAGVSCRPNQPQAPSSPATPSNPPASASTPSTSMAPVPASGPKAEPKPAALAPTTAQPNNTLRDLASRLLESDGQGAWRKNDAASAELERLGPEALNQLRDLLTDQAVEVRRGAAFYLLGQFNPSNEGDARGFYYRLSDPDRTIRGFALSALKQMHRQDQLDALPGVLVLLSPELEPVPENRASVARLCASLKTDAAIAAPQLIAAAAADPVPTVRGACLIALKEVAPAAQAAAPLGKGLTDQDAGVRLVAAIRLRQLGKDAAPAAVQLSGALGDADERIRDAAATTLMNIGGPAADSLAAQLALNNIQARKYSLACLAKIGPPAKSALPAIEKCKQDADPEVRKLAEAAAKQIDAKNK